MAQISNVKYWIMLAIQAAVAALSVILNGGVQ